VITGSAGIEWLDTHEPELVELETVDEHVDCSHRLIPGQIVIERCRKQCALPAIQPFDKALHQMPRKSSGNLIARITANRAFSHTLGPELPVDLLGANVGFRRKTRLWQEPLCKPD
jgi:hypothetical protein